MHGKFGKDLTEGNVAKHLLYFSMPMLAGNLLQTGYSIIDTMWVGNKVGADAVGATAVSFPIIFILIAMASGITMATTILVSQYYGARDYKMVEKVVNNSFAIALILGTLLTIIGFAISDFLLRLMKTPPEVFDLASGYLKISVLGFILMYFVFLATSVLRGMGDTITPLIFMAIGVAVNAILDPILIMGLGPIPRLGLNGAAIASLIAQGVGLLLAIIYLNSRNHIASIDPRKFRLDKHISLLLFKIGFPSIIQQSLISIGNAFITTFVNAFGAATIAAFGAANRVDSLAFMPAMSLSMAVSALTGQNLGANKPERVKEVFKWGTIMTTIITLLVSLLAIGIPRLILSLFVREPEVLDIGVTYLRIVGAGYILFAIMFISNGVINGAGHTITTMLFSLFALWVVRVPFAALLSKTHLGRTGIWLAVVASYGVSMVVSLLYYRSGRWRKSVIKHGNPVIDTDDVQDNQIT